MIDSLTGASEAASGDNSIVPAATDARGPMTALQQAALDDGHPVAGNPVHAQYENRLARTRLGPALGLFVALRLKHAGTAGHSLRVAIAASGWASHRGLSDQQRDVLEVAALLHDVGKLGVSDNILLKPGRLDEAEASAMAQHRRMATEILSSAGAPTEVIDTIVTACANFDGSDQELPLAGDQIPLPGRMLAILDAWDSMTTHHVWRRALSRERALAELFECAGRQFDPELVEQFAEVVNNKQLLLDRGAASRWLDEVRSVSDSEWMSRPVRTSGANSNESLFESKLIENMHHGVVFVDAQRRILQWNTGCERLTGIAADAALGRQWTPSMLQMVDQQGITIEDDDCPVALSVSAGTQVMGRVDIVGRSGRRLKVNVQITPVTDKRGTPWGATLLLQDASSEASLEERCQTLHAEMTRDPLTQVANRAEFDRTLVLFVDAHQETDLPCSLIMADIDHFKKINDTFGHQAGDEAIVSFAKLLKSMCRAGDVVARYGGEEFAVLCADCDNATAATRAEQIRKRLAETTHAVLGNHSFTASFGVSQLQAGDKPETLLRRSDRALLQAKEQGRNQVVQLGDGMAEEPETRGWFAWRRKTAQTLIETTLSTNVPIDLAIQKLQGFISDHAAKILHVAEDEIRMELDDSSTSGDRQLKAVPFVVEVKFSQQHHDRKNAAGLAAGKYVETVADIKIRPRRDRDRRNGSAAERARLLLGSLKSYLMAREADRAEPKANAAV